MRIAVIADDLTGALDTGVQFRLWGYTVQLTDTPENSAAEVVIIITDTRNKTPQQAYQATYSAAMKLRVVHATTHIPFREIMDRLTTERVLTTINIAHDACLSLGIENPRIAVAGLNPHSSDGGIFGDEEETIIRPAIEKARERGLNMEGPVPADMVFGKAAGGLYDIVVAMYHDQGHIPVKLLGMKYDEATGRWESVSGVNITLGLSFIRTSVDHGTAYGKAGRR